MKLTKAEYRKFAKISVALNAKALTFFFQYRNAVLPNQDATVESLTFRQNHAYINWKGNSQSGTVSVPVDVLLYKKRKWDEYIQEQVSKLKGEDSE